MDKFMRDDIDDFIDFSLYHDHPGSFDKHSVSQNEMTGQLREQTGPMRRPSSDSSYESMFSPLENTSNDRFSSSSSGSSSRTAESESSLNGYLGGDMGSGELASSIAMVRDSMKTTPPAENTVAAESARSERARKAANQRHSNGPNKVTKGSEHREAVREKNRVAATKCRWKKKLNETDLETRYRSVTRANDRMKHELLQLRDELTFCRTLALDHLTGHGGCDCGDIQQYNKNQAHITALGVQCQSAYALSPQMQQQQGSPTETYGSRNLDNVREPAPAI